MADQVDISITGINESGTLIVITQVGPHVKNEGLGTIEFQFKDKFPKPDNDDQFIKAKTDALKKLIDKAKEEAVKKGFQNIINLE